MQHFTEEQQMIRRFLIVAISEIEKQMKVQKFSVINNGRKVGLDLFDIPASKLNTFATISEYAVLNQLLEKFQEYIQPNKLGTVDFSQIHSLFNSQLKDMPKSDTKDMLSKLSKVAITVEEDFKAKTNTDNKRLKM